MSLADGVGGYGLNAIGLECRWGMGLCSVGVIGFVDVVVTWWVGKLWGNVFVMLFCLWCLAVGC